MIDKLLALVSQHGPELTRATALIFAVWALVMIGALVYLTTVRRPIAASQVRMFFFIGGVPLGVVAIMALLRFHPELLLEWRILAILAIPIALPLNLALWLPMARRLKPPETYIEAALSRRTVPALILGEQHLCTGEDAFNPTWSELTEKALYTNLHVVGGIGAGKTSALVYPIIGQLLAKHADNPRTKPFALILDVKGGVADQIRQISGKTDRLTDLVEITPGGEWTYNLLAGRDSAMVAAQLMHALDAGKDDAQSHPFYRGAQEAFIRSALDLFGYLTGPGRSHIGHLYQLATSAEWRKQTVDAAQDKARTRGEHPPFLDYFTRTLATMKPSEIQGVLYGLVNDLSLWVRGDFEQTFCANKPSFPGWRAAIDHGLIIVVTLPENQYGESLCKRIGMMLLSDFMDAALARTDPDQIINRDRLVLCVIDEAQKFMSRKLASFASVSRQARASTIILHQNLKQIPPEYLEEISANFRSHVVLSVSDEYSAEYFSRLFGEHKVPRVTKSRSKTRGAAKTSSDPSPLAGGTSTYGTSESRTEIFERRFPYTTIMELPQGRAIASIFDGHQHQPPTIMRLLPYYLPQHQLPPDRPATPR